MSLSPKTKLCHIPLHGFQMISGDSVQKFRLRIFSKGKGKIWAQGNVIRRNDSYPSEELN